MEAVENALTLDELLGVCRSLELRSLSGRSLRSIAKRLSVFPSPEAIRIAYLGNSTFEPLPDYVAAVAACRGLAAKSYIGPYDQHLQELIDPASGFHAFEADLLFLHLLMEKLSPRIAHQFGALSKEEIESERDGILHTLSECARHALETTQASVVVTNFPAPTDYHLGLADKKRQLGEYEFYLELNLAVLRLFKEEARVQLFDLDKLLSSVGKRSARDKRLYYLAKMPWSEQVLPALADELVKHLEAANNIIKKCVVVDLDNTLWGGIVGEVGPEGIEVGQGEPRAEAFFDFQSRLKSLLDRGILLAVCSKNNMADVREAFLRRTDMPLKEGDFSAMVVNWEPKNLGLQHIAETLNIGLDSMVFIDDNPAECDLIRQLLPDVQTVLLPQDCAQYAETLSRIHGLEKAAILDEDRLKTRQYSENFQRQDARRGFQDMESYLHSLETVVNVFRAQRAHIARIHQLFAKTNQFNLTTKRYSGADLEAFIERDDCQLYLASARDRFGDLGNIGVCLVRIQDHHAALIDSFLLSCRAMGRGIEAAIMNYLKREYLQRTSLSAMEGLYIPTKKNVPAKTFYASEGFQVAQTSPTGAIRYVLSRDAVSFSPCDWITLEES